MRFETPLQRGTLIARYKRFFADVRLETGETVVAHCPNPGAMLGLCDPGLPVWLSRSDDPKRKLAHTLELVRVADGLVGVNTMHPNRIAFEAIAGGRVPELAGASAMRREVRYDQDSRIDILLEHDEGRRTFVEVKNVHLLRRPGLAEFPDCATARGVKHLKALQRVVEAGDRAVMLFVVQASGCSLFDTADDIDPTYGAALREAALRGVDVLVYDCHLSPEAIELGRALAWRGSPV